MKVAAAIFLFPLLLATTAQATPEVVLDQEFPGFNWIAYYLDYPGDYMAQTFTVRHTGRLQSIGIAVELGGYSDDKPPVDDLHVRLVNTDEAGAPNIDSILASRDYSWREIPRYPFLFDRYVDFDVSSWNIQVAEGDVLAIALSSDQAAYIPPGKGNLNDNRNYDWWTSAGDRHPGGDFYLYSPILFGPKPHKFIDKWRDPAWPLYPESPRDMGFRVLVVIPEPASILQAFVVGIAFPIVPVRIRRRSTRGRNR
jgi:hypothetical protein